MERDLIKFYDNIQDIGSKDVVQYGDEKGNIMLLPIGQLLVSCEYCELEEPQFKLGIFNKEIDKDIEYNKITTTKVKDKYETTGKEEDRGTLIDTEVEVYQVWIVRNGFQISKSFSDKEEAMTTAIIINSKYLRMAKLIEE